MKFKKYKLTPTQTTICVGVFLFTFIGALVLAYIFNRYNMRG